MSTIEKLKGVIGRYHSAVIAFSGGVDSTFLAAVAKTVLADRLLLVTATSSTYPQVEVKQANKLSALMGIEHVLVKSEELDIAGFAENTPSRCYFCKKELFGKICEIARERGYAVVFDGSNIDDTCDYRPGMRAKRERGVVSPLIEAGFGKKDIREHSRRMGLPTSGKGSFACLASRFPYGETITPEKLKRVEIAETGIRKLNYVQFRVRSHNDVARIEFGIDELEHGWLDREELSEICKGAGFTFVSVDCDGYRTGAMNEVLTENAKKSALVPEHIEK